MRRKLKFQIDFREIFSGFSLEVDWDLGQAASTLLCFTAIYLYLIQTFPPDLMFLETITAGGDMASHYYPAKYLKEHLLPKAEVIGWMPGWYAGMPLFQFYFPLPFVLIALLSYVLPLQIAFKLITVLGVFLLPLCAYQAMRFLGYRFPAPQIAAVFTLPFLYMENHSMWGGNIPSTLAGEFSYGISLALAFLFLGSLYRGLKEDRHVVLNIILLALVALTHVYTVLFVVTTSIILVFPGFWERQKEFTGLFLRRVKYLAKVYVPSFLLCGFWILPLLSGLPYTTSYDLVWIISEELVPPIIWPFLGLYFVGLVLSFKDRLVKAAAFLLGLLLVLCVLDVSLLNFPRHVDDTYLVGAVSDVLWGDAFHARRLILLLFAPLTLLGVVFSDDDRMKYFSFTTFLCMIFFNFASLLGVVDIRFLPFTYLIVFLVSAATVSRLSRNLKGVWLIPVLVLLLTVFWVHDHRALSRSFVSKKDSLVHTGADLLEDVFDGKYEGYIHDWVRWNYQGFEKKTLWPAFKKVNEAVSGDYSDPRVVYEHNTAHNAAGTLRAFESIPLFSGRSTLEGLYMQSSPSSPYVFYVQSEVSRQQSCPFHGKYPCTRFDLERGVKHMRLFNVQYYIARTDKAFKAAENISSLRLIDTFPPFRVYELTENPNQYVTVPKYKPVLFESSDWKTDFYDWFKKIDLVDVPLVHTKRITPSQLAVFGEVVSDGRLSAVERNPLHVSCEVVEDVGRERISFTTTCPGQPHYISVSYHPNWQSTSGEQIYLASPSFMLVHPTSNEVELVFAKTWVDWLGRLMTVAGVILTAFFYFTAHQNLKRFTAR
ncbi:MAG: hypothetical protein GF334_06850 [Candidatus Altiarchaeales archaeon]|nr:hypothetical protein [Candidatus Altiarchaeales archaeon]